MGKPRLKIKKKVIIILTIAVLLIGAGITVGVVKIFSTEKPKEEKPPVEKEEKPKREESHLNLVMVGDCLIHSAIYADAKTSDGYDFKPMIENIKPIIQQHDLAYYNQETILGGSEIGLSHYPRFNSPYEVGDAFLDAGFNLVSLANNHTMDRGEEAVINSLNYWNSKKDLAVTAGSYLTQEDRDAVQIHEKNGITYAFFAYTTVTNGLNPPADHPYYNMVYSYETAKVDIEKVRDQVDIVLVSMHWGTEYYQGVSEEQERIANELSGLGVDIIIGMHPHVLGPIGYVNNTLVLYSLGNFLSAQLYADQLTGVMVSVSIDKVVEGENKTITISNPTATLTYTYYVQGPNNRFKMYTYDQLNQNILPNYMTHYEDNKAVLTSLSDRVQVTPAQ